MKHRIIFLLLFIAANTLYAQTKYPVPGAQVQPQWVFPIWFEDGNGDRDTVYFCYDPNANDFHAPNGDTIFGEYLIEKDTAMFWVGVATRIGEYSNITQMVYVSDIPFKSLFFNKGTYPLKIYWDVILLNSSDLPYPENSPHPRARIDIFCDDAFQNCPYDRGIVIHGDSLLKGTNYFPTAKDSLVFTGNLAYPVGFTLGNFGLELKNYNAPLPVGIKKQKEISFTLYPNPVLANLNVNLSQAQPVQWLVYDYTGAPLLQGKDDTENLHIQTEELKCGLYILRLSINGQFYSKPFIKQ